MVHYVLSGQNVENQHNVRLRHKVRIKKTRSKTVLSWHVTNESMPKWDLKTGDINNVLQGGKIEKIQRDEESNWG